MTSAAITEAQTRAEIGMERAAQHADRVDPGWCERALQALTEFARGQEGAFTIETARFVLTANGLPPAPEERAWGYVTRAASKAGVIVMTDRMAKAVTSNGSPKPLWRRGHNA